MDEKTPTLPVTEAPAPKARKGKRKATAAARKIDPGILELRKEHAEKVRQYRSKAASARMLQVILTKRLAQMTPADKHTLWSELNKSVTPQLPLVDSTSNSPST